MHRSMRFATLMRETLQPNEAAMQERDLARMEATPFDVLIIGGGITGAAVAWDATLRGLSVGLVEKDDFGHGTSAATSKLIHGGLRYLKQMEFDLVRESLRERRIMQTITPHLVYPLPFLVPAYGWGLSGPPGLLGAAALYNALSYDRNRVPYSDQAMPAARLRSPSQTLQIAPQVNPDGLTGGLHYADCQLYDSGRHVLAFLQSAAARGAQVANHAEVTDLVLESDRIRGAVVRDHLTDASFTLNAEATINVTGPWADFVLNLLAGETPPEHVRRSKGIHILTPSIGPDDTALALQTPEGRHLFILPWRGHSLIGTTDVPFEGHPDESLVRERDIRDLLATLNATYPPADLTLDDVQHAYGGLRPIVDEQTEVDTYTASRKYEIYDHTEEDIDGLFTVIGGKYTTSRALAESLVDRLADPLDRDTESCTTDSTPLDSAPDEAFSSFCAKMQRRFSELPPTTVEHLARCYGAALPEVLMQSRWIPNGTQPITERRPDLMLQVDHAVEHEMARRLTDVLHRRTGLGGLGPLPDSALERVAGRMGTLLDWSPTQRLRELDHARASFALPAASPSLDESSQS